MSVTSCSTAYQDIAAVEVVKLDEVDPDALPKLYSEAQKNLGAAAEVRNREIAREGGGG